MGNKTEESFRDQKGNKKEKNWWGATMITRVSHSGRYKNINVRCESLLYEDFEALCSQSGFLSLEQEPT